MDTDGPEAGPRLMNAPAAMELPSRRFEPGFA